MRLREIIERVPYTNIYSIEVFYWIELKNSEVENGYRNVFVVWIFLNIGCTCN